jgi:hypothetical protein
MPNLTKGLNKTSIANGSDYTVLASNDESSAFIKVNGNAAIYATDYNDVEILVAELNSEQNEFEVSWGLYKSFRIAASADIIARMVPRKNKVKASIRNINELNDVPNFSTKDAGRFLVGNKDGKFEWGHLNPSSHFSGVNANITPSVDRVVPSVEPIQATLEFYGAGFYIDTEFYLYEDETGSTANVPDQAEIDSPTNYIKTIFVSAPSSVKVYEDADLDTLKFIDSEGIVRSVLPGNEMTASKVFKGYGRMELHVDSALTSGKDYHVLVVGANGKKKLYKNIISL